MLTLHDFKLAQECFKKAKHLQGVTLSIEHRALNDTLRRHTFSEYQHMKLDAASKLHPMMKRSDSIADTLGSGFPDMLLADTRVSTRDRRHTNIKPKSGLDVVMVEDIDEMEDPLRQIFDAETVLLLNLVK